MDPEKLIEDWYSNIMMAMIINKEIIGSEGHSWSYILAITRGNVRAFLEGFLEEVKTEIWRDSYPNIPTFVKRIVDQIYKQFTGQTYESFKSERTLIHISDALNHLEKISICDMCYFENYCCEYSKYFYIFPRDNWINLVEKFIRKLPAPFNHEVLDLLNIVVNKQRKTFDPKIGTAPESSLGLVISLTRDLLADKCKENILVRDSTREIGKNPRLCCNKYKNQIPSQYGCFPEKKR
ncbi:CCHC-type domain-containing protein [Abeliophyllum distichum]|uniref:CCHC-type domain-containing protein n=1 Tax=Abeliophyllum distichum TaxID=126358 RepID=A0ABD1S9T8_9LAMI